MDADRRRATLSRIVATAAALITLVILGAALPSYFVGLLTEALILALFAMSLDLLLGYTGLASLGHAAYFGTGAYVAGLLTVKLGVSWELASLAALGSSVLVAAIYGLLTLRTTGVYFLMITLALAQILWAIAFRWNRVTGGDDGLPGIGRPDLGLSWFSLLNNENYFYFVLAIVTVSAIAMYVIVRSPFGLALQGIRESESRMAALGHNPWLVKYLVFLISGFFAGLAGVLYGYFKGFVNPDALSVVMSAEVLLMVILGGAGTLVGPFIGALVIVLLSNLISAFTDRWVLILGLIYVLVVLLAPNGLVGLVRSWFGAASGSSK